MDYNDLTEAQKARAKACKTPEDLMTLAKEEGVELTDAQLEAVAGGGWSCKEDQFCFNVTQAEIEAWKSGGASSSW